MKKTIFAAVSSAAITASLISTSVQAEYQTVQMNVAPENMLNVQVLDENGSLVNGLQMNMTDSAGNEVALWETGGMYNTQLSSGIELYSKRADASYHFTEPLSTFTPIAGSYAIEAFDDYSDDGSSAGEFIDDVWFTSGQKRTLTMLTYDPNIAAEQFLLSGTVGRYVDARWANRQATAYFQLDDQMFYLNRTTSALETSPFGAVSKFRLTDLEINTRTFGADYGELSARGGFDSNFSFDTSANSYIKHRMHITDINWTNGIEPAVWDGTTGVLTIGDSAYSLAYDQNCADGLNYSVSVLQIVSGMMVSAPIPDENGYIEFYVDRNTRRYGAYISQSIKEYLTADSYVTREAGDCAYYEFAGQNYHIEVTAVTLPETGDTLMYVPAGSYTLSFTGSVPEGYAVPAAVTVNVAASQEVQNLVIVLEKSFTKGDVNENGSVDLDDTVLTLTHYAHIGAGLGSDLSESQLMAADVNEDGNADLTDASAIISCYAKTAAGLSPQW